MLLLGKTLVEIMDETERRNKINYLSLKYAWESTYYTSLGISFAIFAFIVTAQNIGDFSKVIFSIVIFVILILLGRKDLY